MSESDVIVRLARACAHGHKQMEFVNELLAGETYGRLVPIPVWVGRTQGQAMHYGDCRLGGPSWMSLKKRLINNGFIIRMGEYDKQGKRAINMRFSV
jgi:hypothetical protein